MTTDLRTMMKTAKLPERTVPICLQADLAADHEAAERHLELARRNKTGGMEDGEGPILDRIESLEAQMREHSYDLRLRALPRHVFRTLVKDHPPREDEAGEPVRGGQVLGVSRDTVFPALIRSCAAGLDFDDAEWAELLDEKLTDRQYGDLCDAAWFLNRGEVDVPFSLAASRARRNTGTE